MSAIRTNRLFSKLADTQLSRFLGVTINGLSGTPELDKPPVSVVDLNKLKADFDKAVIDAEKKGPLATAKKNVLRAEVIEALSKNASYVDINCKDDITILLSSGYEPVSGNRTQRVLEPPQVLAVQNGQSGELHARIKADRNAKSFVGRIKESTGGDFGPAISFKNSRSIIFKGLKAGVSYVLQLGAIGGSSGQSDWSDPASGMAR